MGEDNNDTATTEIYTLSLHDSLPIWGIRDRISFPCRSTVFYENRAQWIGKYEKSGERYHGTADVP